MDLTAHASISPIQRGFAPSFVSYKKGTLDSQPQSDKVYQLLAQSRWFSPGSPASSSTKTGRHDIAEILLKVALKHQAINQYIYTRLTHVSIYRLALRHKVTLRPLKLYISMWSSGLERWT